MFDRQNSEEMENIIIEKCEKRPGIIVGARAYKLILNDDGLYILELGKAMGHSNKSTAISDAILDKIQKKREGAHADKKEEIAKTDLNDLIDNKKNFLLTKQDIKTIKADNLEYIPKLSIKSSVMNITLHFDQADRANVEKIFTSLN